MSGGAVPAAKARVKGGRMRRSIGSGYFQSVASYARRSRSSSRGASAVLSRARSSALPQWHSQLCSAGWAAMPWKVDATRVRASESTAQPVFDAGYVDRGPGAGQVGVAGLDGVD